MKRFIKYLAISSALLGASCTNFTDSASALAGMGNVREEKSTFDDSEVVSVSPAPLYKKGSLLGVPFMVGGIWKSNNPNSVGLVLSYSSSTASSNLYTSFSSLDINIGGKFYSYSKSGQTSLNSGGYNSISKQIYTESTDVVIIPMSVFQQMLSGNDVRVRLNSSDGPAEANFSEERIPGGQATAKFYLKKFADRISTKR